MSERWNWFKTVITWLGLSLVLMLLTGLVFFYLAISPRLTAQHQLQHLARDYAKLTDVSDVAVFNGADTYYSIRGKDDNEQDILLLLSGHQEQPELISLDNLLSHEELLKRAEEEGLVPQRVVAGRHNNRLVWEIKSQEKYYIFDAETGDLITVWG
ncbi:DUF5590 domain-containing protein [Streptococcus sp. E24BD]|uniref:cell wall elongation regulator TseB-like domain-containing protein n=1 Tax=Streptococcus sp. E24BD TaxID=3278715 RepID=UPI00359D9F85